MISFSVMADILGKGTRGRLSLYDLEKLIAGASASRDEMIELEEGAFEFAM